jgi:hypothetical protein
MDDLPPKKTSFAYSSLSVQETDNDPWRSEEVLLHDKRKTPNPKTWWKRVGWPVGALGSATMASVALLVNTIVVIWTVRAFGIHEGVAQVFAGNCRKAERINTFLHLGINAVSTMLLSGSNYCMQILSAPTRKEVDKVHAKKKWLDVGVPSVRNLNSVAWRKRLIWWVLGLSSIPLHLMYNSVFFSTIATNEYDVIFATEAFVGGGPNGGYDEIGFSGLKDTRLKQKPGTVLKILTASMRTALNF